MAGHEGTWRNKGCVEECSEQEGEGMTQVVQKGCQGGKWGHHIPFLPQVRLLAGYGGELSAPSLVLACFVGVRACQSLGSASLATR